MENKAKKSIISLVLAFLLTLTTLTPAFAAETKNPFFNAATKQEMTAQEVRSGIKDGSINIDNIYKMDKNGKYVKVKDLDAAMSKAILAYMSENGITDVQTLMDKIKNDSDVAIAVAAKIQAEQAACESKDVNELTNPEAAAVEKLIADLPVEITLKNKEAVVAARAAYDALTEAQKALVKNLSVLTDAEAKIAELEATINDAEKAAAVEKLIADLPAELTLENKEAVVAARAAYDALTEAQKALVKNIDALKAAEAKIAELEAQANSVENVNKLIEALPAVDLITIEDADKVGTARDAYNALSEADKKLVKPENVEKLNAILEKMKDLDAAQEVIIMIESLDKNSPTFSADVAAAREAFDKLTVAQKALVTNAQKLEDAEKELNKVNVKSVKVINATTVEVAFAEALEKDFNLTGKTITLTAGETKLTATYQADSYLNGVANFVLAKDEVLVDASEYTVSADWAKFATDKFVAKIVAPYIKTVTVTTENVPAKTHVATPSESGTTTIYFTAKDQYGNDIALAAGNVASLKAYATLNGMPLTDAELDDEVDTTGTITIKKTLAEGSNLVVTFKNDIGQNTVVVGTKSFTVAKAAIAVPTTIGNLKAINTVDNKEITALATNDVVKLTVVVKDQFGNPMVGQNVRWFVEEGEDFIAVTAPTTMPGDAAEMEFTAKSAGNIQISAFLENGQKVTYTATIGADKLETLTYKADSPVPTKYNNEEIVLGKITPNPGATLTPEMIKFEVKAIEPATAEDVVVSARLRGGNDQATAKDIVVVAKSTKVGTYKITPYVGVSFTDENVIKAEEITLITTLNITVASMEVEAFAENELTAGNEGKKAVTFRNKHGEIIPVNAEDITIVATGAMKNNVKMYKKDGTTEAIGKVPVEKLGFIATEAGDYTVTVVTGSVSKQLNITVAKAAELATLELGANITSGVIAGTINGANADPYIRIVEIKDQYHNDFIPANFIGLPVEVSDWATLTKPTATFAYYNYNEKKEMVVNGVNSGVVNYETAEGVVLVIDANGSNNPADKIATITVKAGEEVLDTVSVTVKALRKVDSVTLTPVSTNLALDGTTTLKVEVKDQYGDLFQVDVAKIAKSANDVVQLEEVTQAKDDKKADIKGAYTISVKGFKIGTQEVKVDVKDAENAILASAKVTFTVKAAGETINSIVIDETSLASLYSTSSESGATVPLSTIAKDANGNVVAIPASDLMWSVVEVLGADGKPSADAVTATAGNVVVPKDFVGTVKVKVTTANLKEDTVVLNFDNAPSEAILSTIKVMYNNTKEDVAVVSPAEVKMGTSLVVFLKGLDQYGKDIKIAKDVTPFSENTAVATVSDTGEVTITPVSLGTAKINLIYNGTAYSITVEVVPAAE